MAIFDRSSHVGLTGSLPPRADPSRLMPESTSNVEEIALKATGAGYWIVEPMVDTLRTATKGNMLKHALLVEVGAVLPVL